MVIDEIQYYSMKEMADNIGMTKQGIMHRIKKLRIVSHKITSTNKLYSEKQYFMIKNFMDVDKKEDRVEVIYVQETYWIIPSKLNFM